MRMAHSKCILDSEMNLKLCGMSRWEHIDGPENSFNRITGAIEYMAPEIF
jgi:hypothetical protein